MHSSSCPLILFTHFVPFPNFSLLWKPPVCICESASALLYLFLYFFQFHIYLKSCPSLTSTWRPNSCLQSENWTVFTFQERIIPFQKTSLLNSLVIKCINPAETIQDRSVQSLPISFSKLNSNLILHMVTLLDEISSSCQELRMVWYFFILTSK